jgi:hypothetical protein
MARTEVRILRPTQPTQPGLPPPAWLGLAFETSLPCARPAAVSLVPNHRKLIIVDGEVDLDCLVRSASGG